MQSSFVSFRSISVAAALVLAGASAQALTIPANSLVANSVQTFSQESQDAFDVGGVTVEAMGNATQVAGAATGTFTFPITSITISSSLKIASGDAKGSALLISRVDRKLGKVGVYVANFTINYDTKQVLADTTPMGGATVKQSPLYNFHTATPLGIKYQFPLKITGHEVLDQLTLTPEMHATMVSALALPVYLVSALDSITTFGTLTQDIDVKLRPKAVSTTPYTPPTN